MTDPTSDAGWLQIRGWQKFQHRDARRHNSPMTYVQIWANIDDDLEFLRLSTTAQAQLQAILRLAARKYWAEGKLPADPSYLRIATHSREDICLEELCRHFLVADEDAQLTLFDTENPPPNGDSALAARGERAESAATARLPFRSVPFHSNPDMSNSTDEFDRAPGTKKERTDMALRVFDRFNAERKRAKPGARDLQPTAGRIGKIAARIREGATEDELTAAAVGIFRSDHHRENGYKWATVDLCYRDAEHLERFAAEGSKAIARRQQTRKPLTRQHVMHCAKAGCLEFQTRTIPADAPDPTLWYCPTHQPKPEES
jgi:hypothetical protein